VFDTRNNNDDDDKITTISHQLTGEYVTELMRELKELRNEIATLKIDKRIPTSMRTTSTSPLPIDSRDTFRQTLETSTSTSSLVHNNAVSQFEVDAETQTDFRSIQHRRRSTSKQNKKTMIGSSVTNKKKSQGSPMGNVRRTFSSSSTNTGSDQEGRPMIANVSFICC
jgi:hypothetical protein